MRTIALQQTFYPNLKYQASIGDAERRVIILQFGECEIASLLDRNFITNLVGLNSHDRAIRIHASAGQSTKNKLPMQADGPLTLEAMAGAVMDGAGTIGPVGGRGSQSTCLKNRAVTSCAGCLFQVGTETTTPGNSTVKKSVAKRGDFQRSSAASRRPVSAALVASEIPS
jgi:hypothetical protein